MEWLERMNDAIDYIESHLVEGVDYDRLAKLACCSTYHFQRMFSFITGVSLSEYIRRRRLTLAAFELQSSSEKVIDVALKYGYGSPEAFSRAFKSLHGVTPRAARYKEMMLKAYPRMTFYLSIRGDVEMDYRIEEKEAFEMFGVSTKINNVDHQGFVEIPVFWDRCIEDGSLDRIHEIAGIPEHVWCHAALHSPREDGFSYMIGYYVLESAVVPEDFYRLSVPALTWAVFPTDKDSPIGTGKQIQGIWPRIFPEWFPTSGYEHAEGPEFEMYFSIDGDRHNNYGEIWIPVVKP